MKIDQIRPVKLKVEILNYTEKLVKSRIFPFQKNVWHSVKKGSTFPKIFFLGSYNLYTVPPALH